MPYSYQQLKNNHETLGIILAFLVLEPPTYKREFGNVVEQVLAQITLKQYTLQVTESGEIVGYALWGKFDKWVSEVFQSGLRPLHMLEYKSGNNLFVTNLGTSNAGSVDELRTWIEKELP